MSQSQTKKENVEVPENPGITGGIIRVVNGTEKANCGPTGIGLLRLLHSLKTRKFTTVLSIVVGLE